MKRSFGKLLPASLAALVLASFAIAPYADAAAARGGGGGGGGGARAAGASGGAARQSAHVDNSWVLKPNVAVWYDVLKHVGVGVGAAYLVARPEETITTASGVQARHLKTDALELTAGVTFGLWKKKS